MITIICDGASCPVGGAHLSPIYILFIKSVTPSVQRCVWALPFLLSILPLYTRAPHAPHNHKGRSRIYDTRGCEGSRYFRANQESNGANTPDCGRDTQNGKHRITESFCIQNVSHVLATSDFAQDVRQNHG